MYYFIVDDSEFLNIEEAFSFARKYRSTVYVTFRGGLSKFQVLRP